MVSLKEAVNNVSIQVMSPTSGDVLVEYSSDPEYPVVVSIQVMSPTSGDLGQGPKLHVSGKVVSIQVMSPTSGDG